MVQSLRATHLDDPLLETLMATFGAVFHSTSVWNLGHGEYMLIGSAEDRSWSLDAIRERVERPEVQVVLASQGLQEWPILLTTQWIGFENGFHLVPDDTLIHTEFLPVLNTLAARAYGAPAESLLLKEANEQLQARPSLLLSQYAQSNTWNLSQMRAMSLLQLDHQLYDPVVFRSVVRRWLDLSPEETALQILSASTSSAESAWAYETARLRAHLSSFDAGNEPPLDLVKQITYHTLQTYRDQRTVFHRPETKLLQSMLEHLVKEDPVHQRIYRMNLAELAWDRGDEDALLRWSTEAFDTDTEMYGPVDYTADPMAPYRTLSLLGQYWWSRGELDKAREICIQALQSQYIGPEAIFHDPMLDLVVRKILFSLDLSAAEKDTSSAPLEIESSR